LGTAGFRPTAGFFAVGLVTIVVPALALLASLLRPSTSSALPATAGAAGLLVCRLGALDAAVACVAVRRGLTGLAGLATAKGLGPRDLSGEV